MATFRLFGSSVVAASPTNFNGFAATTALAGGGYVVVWEREPLAIVAQRYDAAGAKVGGEISISPPSSLAFHVDVAATADGGFIVVWSQFLSNLSESVTYVARAYDASGAPLSAPFTLPFTEAVGFNASVDVTARPSGDFVVTALSGASVATAVITKAGGVSPFAPATQSAMIHGVSAVASDGVTLLVWRNGPASGSGDQVFAQIIAANGVAGPVTPVTPKALGPRYGDPKVAALPDGRFVVSYSDDNVAQATILSHAGGVSIAPFAVFSEISGPSDIVVTQDGGFLIASSLRGQQFDPRGAKYGPAFDIGNPAVPPVSIALTRLADGSVAAALSVRAGADPVHVETVHIELARTMFGGAGADVLVSGALDDLLDGGAGADRMSGGLGDDLYVVDNPGDVVVESASEGVDTVRAAISSYALPANVENAVALSVGGGVLTGNALNNTLVGSDGPDVLDGGAGDDVLSGGLGADQLFGRDGADQVFGEAGDDILAGGPGADLLVGGAGSDTFRFGPGDAPAGERIFGASQTGGPAAGEENTIAVAGVVDLHLAEIRHVSRLAFDAAGAATISSRQFSAFGANTALSVVGSAGVNVLQVLADPLLTTRGDPDPFTTIDLSGFVFANWGPEDRIEIVLNPPDALFVRGTAYNDVITVTAPFAPPVADLVVVLDGGAGDDVLIGTTGAEQLSGGDGADRLLVSGGDSIYGGAGRDVAVFDLPSAQVSLVRDQSGVWFYAGPNGAAGSIRDVEFAQFADRTFALPAAKGSIDGNGTSDIVLRSAAGAVAVWQIAFLQISNRTIVAQSDPTYAAAGHGDFDGDGKADLLFRNAGGLLVEWRMNGPTVAGAAVFATDPNWAIAGVGDFNGDGKDDILYRNPSGLLAEWQMDGLAASAVGVFAVSDPAWTLAQVADFNGDGKDDLLWRNSTGFVALWQMDGFAVTSASVIALSDPSWTIVGTGDFNGDLREDILWRSQNGILAQWQMDGGVATNAGVFSFPPSTWSVAAIGDYDGNGRDDILWLKPDGSLVFWSLNGFEVSFERGIGNPGAGWTDIV